MHKGFTLNGRAVTLNKVDSGTYTFTNTADGLVLNINNLTADSSASKKGIVVTAAGGADILMPQTSNNVVTIAGTTYTYNTTGNSYFLLDSDEAEGFVFGQEDDYITFNGTPNLNLYSVDDPGTELEFVDSLTVTSSGDYRIAKASTGYTVVIIDSKFDDEVIYSATDKSLTGLNDGSKIYATGAIKKIFVPVTASLSLSAKKNLNSWQKKIMQHISRFPKALRQDLSSLR